jgi:alpha-1,3-rhamnosyl/mannosyltransferase
LKKIRVVVNAMPLTKVRTGIGRYVESLYTVMERDHSDVFEFRYFDGTSLSASLPPAPKGVAGWSRLASLFWRLPPPLAYRIRLGLHTLAGRRLSRLSNRFDVYHETALVPFPVGDETATLLTVHDMSLKHCAHCHPRERVLFFDRLFADGAGRADAISAVSNFTRGELLAATEVRPERVRVTPLACDGAIFHPREPAQIEAVKQELRIDGSYFLFVGTNDPRKNLTLVVEALRRGNPDTRLVVAGWSGWGDKLPEGVRNVGYVSDEILSCLYSGATALIFPSLYEGFGLPVLEAMSCGCPVVLTREASLPEVAGEAGCYLAYPRDADGLAALMARLETDGKFRAAKSAEALERAGRFSWERTARLTREALLAAYQKKNP